LGPTDPPGPREGLNFVVVGRALRPIKLVFIQPEVQRIITDNFPALSDETLNHPGYFLKFHLIPGRFLRVKTEAIGTFQNLEKFSLKIKWTLHFLNF
jgi:hypothetical protein